MKKTSTPFALIAVLCLVNPVRAEKDKSPKPIESSISSGLEVLTQPVNALAGEKFTIVTKPRLGFREGSKMYQLEQPIATFIESFGPAEKITSQTIETGFLAHTKTHYYINDGILITENKDGVLVGIIFRMSATKAMLSAKVKTAEGITSGASLREITKIYGVPFKKIEHSLLGYLSTKIHYKYADDVISFEFRDGKLENIGLAAQYLPYLQQ
ncbi:hypothetical protein [Chamaesiphon sp.]|uniref:hypothetical protein n=1 Tax=Chamaesiphon sp. TaxID=2814140 RepID=UPI00359342B9